MRAAIAITLALCATAASAMPPPLPECYFDKKQGQLVPAGQATPETAFVYSYQVGIDFLSWDAYSGPTGSEYPVLLAIQNCRTGAELSVQPPRQGYEPMIGRWEEMVYGDTGYTTRQIKDVMTDLGAKVRISRNALGACACDEMSGN